MLALPLDLRRADATRVARAQELDERLRARREPLLVVRTADGDCEQAHVGLDLGEHHILSEQRVHTLRPSPNCG